MKLKHSNPNYHNPTIQLHSVSEIVKNTSHIPAHRTAHIKKVLATTWFLSTEFKDSVLLNHFLLYWDRKYFRSQAIDGTIYKDGRLFKIIYYNCTPQDCISEVVKNTSQLALSFRVPRHIYEGAYPVVLVTTSSHRKSH